MIIKMKMEEEEEEKEEEEETVIIIFNQLIRGLNKGFRMIVL